jgi:hypothetical protein
LKKKRIFIKNAADVSMTSATLGYQADNGPKVAQWARPVGPMDLSPPDLPGFDPEVQVVSWALLDPDGPVCHIQPISQVKICSLGGLCRPCSAPWRVECSPRRRAFRQRRCARPEAWGGSGGKQIGVEYLPLLRMCTHTPEHWDSANGRSELAVGFNTHNTRHRSGALVLEQDAQVRRWGASGQAATAHECPCKKIQCSARRPARIQGWRGARCLAPRHGGADRPTGGRRQ